MTYRFLRRFSFSIADIFKSPLVARNSAPTAKTQKKRIERNISQIWKTRFLLKANVFIVKYSSPFLKKKETNNLIIDFFCMA